MASAAGLSTASDSNRFETAVAFADAAVVVAAVVAVAAVVVAAAVVVVAAAAGSPSQIARSEVPS